MDIKAIQAQIDIISNTFKNLTSHQVSNRIEATRRKNDSVYKENCKAAQQKSAKLRKAKGIKQQLPTAMAVTTPFGKFRSQGDFNTWANKQKFSKKIDYFNKNIALPHLYYATKKGPGKVITETVFYTPYGYSKQLKDLLALAKKAKDSDATNKFPLDWFKKMNYRQPENYYKIIEPKREWLLEIGENQ